MIYFNSDCKIIVTGASSGIGEATALLLNELGATIIAIARNQEKLESVKAKSKFPDKFFVELKDLSEDIENFPSYLKMIKDKYGKFMGLVWCAGKVINLPFKSADLEVVHELFTINYYSPYMFAKSFSDKRNNIGKGTSIIFIIGGAVKTTPKALSIYSASKAALLASAKTISRELSVNKIRVNTISPTDIITPMTLADPDILESKKDSYPLGFGEPLDVAYLTAFLLSDRAEWITGQDYVVDCASF